jgi:ketosteroid isomerase-like protein
MTRHSGGALRHLLAVALVALPLAACASHAPPVTVAEARQQVMATERAFAKTMADRSLDRFATFVAPEAIFYSGPTPRVGKAQVVEWWARYFAGPSASFSWEPDDVQVLESGTLALSTGPVRDTTGAIVARFNSIWRRDARGAWRIVFDKGNDVCQCASH